MSVHWDSSGRRWVIRFRDHTRRHRTVTVNEKNLRRYGEVVPTRITERVAKRLEKAALSQETALDGSIRSIDRRKLLWLEVVARYLPPLRDPVGQDTWQDRPPQPLENEKTYSRNQLDRMQRVLGRYFPGYLNRGEITWKRKGSRKHHRVELTHACAKVMDSITREDVAGFQIHLTDSGLSPASVRGYMITLKTFLSWCCRQGYVLTNPAQDVSLPPRKKKEVKWLTKDWARALLKAVKGHCLEGPVRTILGLGIRRGEMINIEWSDVNFGAKSVKIRGTKTASAFRGVPLPKSLATYYRSLKCSSEWPNVLLNGGGKPWNKDSLNTALRRFLASGRVASHWNFQILRATYGSLLVQKGIPIAHVSLVLGHSDVKVTQGWYIGLSSADVSPMIGEVIGQILD